MNVGRIVFGTWRDLFWLETFTKLSYAGKSGVLFSKPTCIYACALELLAENLGGGALR